ncbi:MAG: replication endonuclease [bacterium]|nr:replication endonuclease [bacterium]
MIDVRPFLAFPDAAKWTHTFTREQKKYLAATVRPVQPLAGMLASVYVSTAKRFGYVQANNELRAIPEKLLRHDLNLSWSDEDLCRWCQHRAEKATPLLRAAEATDSEAVMLGVIIRARAMLGRYGFELPDVETYGPIPVMRRLVDAAQWRRWARKLQAQEVEKIAILLGRVRMGAEIYCSDETVRRRSAQKHRNRKYLEATTAENQEGQTYTLAELSDLSVSNPRHRRSELMVRIRGFDDVAVLLGHVREFWTLTTPSRFHRFTTVATGKYKAGKPVRVAIDNKNWDKETTPGDAQKWQTKNFSRIRAALARRGVRLYGMRVVEAHHDGTPHWHMAVFYHPHWQGDERRAASPRVRAIVRRYAIKGMQASDALERGAKERRADFKAIDPERGDAAGYLAKYITKAIPAEDTGTLVQQDLYGYDGGDSARRVEACMSCWGSRQFQQLGGPSVQAYREMRRAMAGDVTQADLFDAPKQVQLCADAADEGDWSAFVLMMGGPTVRRDDQTVRLGYWTEHTADGEVIGTPLTRYGEIPKDKIFGLTYDQGEGHILTRAHTWTIHRPGEEKPEVKAPEFEAERKQAVRGVMAEVESLKVFRSDFDFDFEGEAFGFGFYGGANAPPLECCQ